MKNPSLLISRLLLPALFTLLLLRTDSFSQSKDLYVPLNIKTAFDKQTRSHDGMPGKNYWQNRSVYKIKASLDPKTKVLSGTEKITYFNNSPDTLSKLVIRLYQDILKSSSARDFPVGKRYFTDGVNVEKLSVGGREVNLNDFRDVSRTGTNMIVEVPGKVMPKSPVELEVSWNFTMPNASFRMGTYGDSTFMVAYWYPQMAVYDDIDGWDMTNYTGTVEFYNDFSDYDVELTEPKDVCVWATGELQNAGDIFNDKYIERISLAKNSDKVVNIVTKEDLSKKAIYKDKESHTWHFKAGHVPDFAFAMSSRYLWDGVSIEVDENTKRRTFISAAFNDSSKDFYEVASIARKTVESLSFDLPGVPYPYPSLTIFNGEGGMEFPMMVNDGSMEKRSGTVHVTSHEITHTYFPFFMGTNERKYAWMDEGWATMIPFDLQASMAQDYDPRSENAKDYARFAGSEEDMPLMTLSYMMKWDSYRIASYRKPGTAYDMLRGLLGHEKFDNALREYISRWNGKHPGPFDFFNTFNDFLKEDLSWFWKPWFFEKGYPDLAIKEVKVEDNKLKLLITNEGTIPIPINLNVTWEDGRKTNIPRSADVWKNSDSTWIECGTSGKLKTVELGDPSIPDANNKNNYFEFTKQSSL
ncbi:MAG TPA: M1 family metallopeptidase [Ignavibacteriales bacterium]|nr:M1 family metallopeptidase [Ignavibacteriales bacterium]